MKNSQIRIPVAQTTAAYYAAFLAMGISMSVLGPTLPGLAKQVQASLGAIGILFTARSLGSLIGSVGGGVVYDHLKGHRLMALMITISAILAALIPYVPLLWLLTALLFFTGAAQGMLNIGGNTLLVWLHGANVGPYMNGLHFAFGVGTFLTPILVAQFITRPGGLTTTYLLAGILILPTALVALLPSPVNPHSRRSQDKPRVDPWLVVLIGLVFGTYSGASTGFGGWIYTYALQVGLADARSAAYLTSAFWGAFTLGRLAAIPLARRFQPRAILAADFGGGLVALLAMLFWPHSAPAVIFTAAAFGFALASIYPTTMSLASQLLPISGRITGMFSVGNSVGMMVVPWAIGQLFDSAGPASMAWVLMVDMASALGVLALLARWTRKSNSTAALLSDLAVPIEPEPES